jgi:hypothetical protein
MWRRTNRTASAFTALLLIGAAGCVDLDVQNPNDPDAGRAISTAGDVQALISGAFSRWQRVQWYDGFTMAMSNASGEHVAPWGNSGMEMYARIPRVPTSNVAGGAQVLNIVYQWFESYRAIAAVRDGLKSIDDGAVDLDADLGPGSTLRARAFGKYMQGLAHATIATLYDSGFVYDETIDPGTVTLQGYQDVMTAALAYFAEAATLASSGSFTIPAEWMSVDVSSATLAQLARSQAARFRANVARTPAERAAVDWNAVAADAAAGVTADWSVHSQCFPHNFCEEGLSYRLFPGWQMQNNWVAGMADQSGAYQAWIGTPTLSKVPFIIVTPDTRWPQGPDEATQLANPGTYYSVNSGSSRIWARPDRGTWRWSYYYQTYEPYLTHSIADVGDLPLVTVREMKALIAERDYRAGNLAAVASFVNETRTLAGLNATDAAGTNTSCVPKLPNGSCGDLWEMFKWEKRIETQFAATLRSGWWLDGRGWGDLMEGTLLQFPVPYQDYQLLGLTPYNFGGVGGVSAAPIGTYGY